MILNLHKSIGLAGLLALASAGAAPRTFAPGAARAALSFQDVGGRAHALTGENSVHCTALLFISAQCPVSNLYTPRMAALAKSYQDRGVAFYAVYPDADESMAEVKAHAAAHGIEFPVVRDASHALTRYAGAKMTPESVLIDSTGKILYRGRIDDNVISTRVRTHDLAEAIDAELAGKPLAVSERPSFGCAIRSGAPAPTARAGVPTWSGAVASILNSKCVSCHRTGEVAPFALQSFAQAHAWAGAIKTYTASGAMPPWKPADGYGTFKNVDQHTLSSEERATLAKWADAGAPEGNPALAPKPPHFTQGWQLGQPDLVLKPERAFHLAADGDDVYRNFVIDPHFTEDRWVSAVEIRAGNRSVVHHVINYIDTSGASDKLEAKQGDGQPGYVSFGGPGFLPAGMIGGWAPGNDPAFLPSGIAMHVPKGCRIVVQVHYHKDGKPEVDQTSVGLHFAKAPVTQAMRNMMVLNYMFQLPPGQSRYEVKSSTVVNQPIHAIAVTPHMHLLGREIKVWATLPDGTERPMVWIKDWDFNWQANYHFKTPMALPEGTRINLVAYYDNSAANERNPNRLHLKPVTWGEQTTDEMCLAFVAFTRDGEHIAPSTHTASTR